MDQVSEVREKIDLVSLISEYLPLKKAGRNFKMNCPFHGEKTPSFVVSPERQIWHCFGCGKGGDAFTFLMEYENMEFPEALRILAKKTNVELRSFGDATQYSQKEKIYDVNKLTKKFYNYLLTKHIVGKPALTYLLEKRKLNKALIDTYSLGYSPRGNLLSNYLIKKKNYNQKDLIDAGLVFSSMGRAYDFFRGRIMFPLSDHRGNIVGFSGRALTDKDQPKYINTKDTIVYHKGNLFFGLDSAKEEIKSKNQAIIVEGEFDVLSCKALGIKNVVAIKGTALTEAQANLLSRFTQKVTLCLDKDKAGFEATKRSLGPLEKNNLTTTIVLLGSKDPDEAIKEDPVAFKKAIKNDMNVYDFLISEIASSYDKKSAEGKKKITEELLPFISQIGNEVVKEHYLKKLADTIETSYEAINREIDKIKREQIKEESIISKTKRARREILEEYLLSLIIQSENPKKIIEKEKKFMSQYKFNVDSLAKILDYLKMYFNKEEKFNPKKFSSIIPNELTDTYNISSIYPLPKFENKEVYYKEIEKIINELLTFHIKNKMEAVSAKLRENKDVNKQRLLQKEFSELVSLLPKS